jgi:hypothetical protein
MEAHLWRGGEAVGGRLLKNTHLLRYAHSRKLSGSLRRTGKYDSFLRISRALHLDVFDQPEKDCIINNPLEQPDSGMITNPSLRGEAAAISA